MITSMMCRVFEIEEKTKKMEILLKEQLEEIFFNNETEAYYWLRNAHSFFEKEVGDIMPESFARELSRCTSYHIIK
jgi:hypothetical protein